MAGVTKVNGVAYARDVLYATQNHDVFKITPTTALTAGLGGTAQAVADALNAQLFQTATNGASCIVVVDGHSVDAASIDARLTEVLGEAVTVAAVTDLYGIS